MASIIETFLKTRVYTDECGTNKWHGGFKKMRAYAEEKGIPLVAVWLNSKCGYSNIVASHLIGEKFTGFMSDSGCAFWCGVGGIDSKREEALGGTGYSWILSSIKATMYPLVRIYWKKGGNVLVDKSYSGADCAEGIAQLGTTLSEFLNAPKSKKEETPKSEPAKEEVSVSAPAPKKTIKSKITEVIKKPAKAKKTKKTK